MTIKLSIFILIFLFAIPALSYSAPILQLQSELYFGSYIDTEIILIEIIYHNKKKEIGIVLHEDEQHIWILTEKGLIGIREKKDTKINVLRIKNKRKGK